MDSSKFYVYIMTDEQHRRLYTGRTGNLRRRVSQHRSGNGGVYTRRYNLVRLVYYEPVQDHNSARLREKQLKRWSKKQRVKLIEEMNPAWEDLFEKI
jgi:putative endonuclease